MKYPNLEIEMQKNNESRHDLAKLLGITYSSVSYKINGKRTITIEEIKKICKHYKKPFEYLFATEQDIKRTMQMFKKLMEG